MDSETTTTTTETKHINGYAARFGTDPDQIFIDLDPSRPAYIRVREGDYIQEGDAFEREQLGRRSPTSQTWEVIEISPGTVTGENVRNGETIEWNREELEKGLVDGTYSTNLTDFEMVSTYQVGRWRDYDRDSETGGLTYTGRPYVSVVAYGNNGLKYGRRYCFVDEDSNELMLWKQDIPLDGFSEEAEARLGQRVREALEADGFTIRERDE